MSKNKVILFGASGHAKVVIDVFEQMKTHEILGLFDDHLPKETYVLGYQVIGNFEEVRGFLSRHEDVRVFIAIGDNWTRSLIKGKLEQQIPHVKWAKAVHPCAYIGKGSVLGEGVAIFAGAMLNPEVRLGDFTIIGSNSNIDHESQLGDFASLGPGCTLGGNVEVGEFSAVGLGANIIHGIRIGDHTVIGAGATVVENMGDRLVAYGTPAKATRTREEGEKYL